MILFPLLLCWTALLVGLAQGAPKLLLCSDSTASEYKTGQLQGYANANDKWSFANNLL
jgi:hypothetical protein